MNAASLSLLFSLALLVLIPTARIQAHQQSQQHWTETDSETLWRTRYGNCDYGYYVLLGDGVIAHGTHSPNPNHGFLIPLPEIGRTSLATNSEPRFLWVDASYDSWDDKPSLAHAVRDKIKWSTEERQSSKLIQRKPTALAGLKAEFFKIAYASSANQLAIDEETVALRSDIVYTVGLRTDKLHQVSDEAQMRRILAGFRLTKLPIGECSN